MITGIYQAGAHMNRSAAYRRRHTNARIRIILFSFLGIIFITLGVLVGSSFLHSSQTNAMTDSVKYYKSIMIEEGDSLWNIAHTHYSPEFSDYNAYIAEVKQINHLSSSEVFAGDYIVIPYFE